MKSPRPCAVCGQLRRAQLYRRKFTKLSGALLSGYDVVACSNCGFCFADDLPSQQELDDYYEKQSKYEHDSRGGAASEYDTRRLPFAVSIISSWLGDRNARIVDIGCANGGLLVELRKNGFNNVVGIDPSPSCARTAKELYGIDVHVAPISRIPGSIGLFDVVILGSVLEHIVDLKGTIDRIKALLNPCGQVYIEVPDMSRCSQLNDAPFQEFSVEHINFYGPISLRNLWEQNGFATTGIRQTEIEQVPGLTVYEIKAMFRLNQGSVPTPSISFDHETRAEIEKYINVANRKLQRVDAEIAALADAGSPIVVWGVGTHTQSLFATTRLGEVNIRAFFDSNTRYVGQTLAGIPIHAVDELRNWDLPVLISSQQFQNEIVSTIRDRLRLTNPLITLYEGQPPAK
jgi:SAM-dependent methyltransferase